MVPHVSVSVAAGTVLDTLVPGHSVEAHSVEQNKCNVMQLHYISG